MVKTKSVEPLTRPEDVEALREVLEQKRFELRNLYEKDVRTGQETSDDSADDSVDRANNSFSRELMFSLSDTERRMLILIDEAFDRLAKGTFGTCTHCGETVGLPRLKAVPWTRHCIACQESEEQGTLSER